ncbi:hypothetical protein I4U23_029552 [Adineta vaga]|nr:hypothetical protein I4U23_029552 [Adineta vaga]
MTVHPIRNDIYNVSKKNISTRSTIEKKLNDQILIDQWQDYVLTNAILTNYLNILLIHTSRTDFSLLNNSNQCTIYIKPPHSFRQTISQLTDKIRYILIEIYKDFNRIQIHLQNIPTHLKLILLLIKKGNKTTINTKLPDLLRKSEILVHESLTKFQNSQTKMNDITNLLHELNSLLSSITADTTMTLQVEDIQDQWILLSQLFNQLAYQAEKNTDFFLLQFNWILEEFLLLDINSNRDLIINLLKSKVLDIDRITDLLTIISQTFGDISSEYLNEKLIDNAHLSYVSNEQERKHLLKQYRYELQPQIVKFTRLALKRHDDFLQRNQNRQRIHDEFLIQMSENDLNILLSMN